MKLKEQHALELELEAIAYVELVENVQRIQHTPWELDSGLRPRCEELESQVTRLEESNGGLMADVGGLQLKCERLEAELARLRPTGEAPLPAPTEEVVAEAPTSGKWGKLRRYSTVASRRNRVANSQDWKAGQEELKAMADTSAARAQGADEAAQARAVLASMARPRTVDKKFEPPTREARAPGRQRGTSA